MSETIRQLFRADRPIDRPIEKVIDYSAREDKRLEREISEYQVTPSVERAFTRFLDHYERGVQGGETTEIGVWVSGFYGSGKSSLTKYLGFAFSGQKVHGVPFIELLAERLPTVTGQHLRTLARRHPAAVFMLDLATDQLAESSSISVANVLYWNVLKSLGYSTEQKVADLEVDLERDGRRDEFLSAYAEMFPGKDPWDAIKNDPRLAVLRASKLAPRFYPDRYTTPAEFQQLQYKVSDNLGDIVQRLLTLIHRKTERKNIIFFVDEVGQYVAPRRELILNLDGLVRKFKELGEGRVWFVATGQQTLLEISEKAAINSTDLSKLKDRFPIAIDLEASDIQKITVARLLQKSAEGKPLLQKLYRQHGETLQLHTHLPGWPAPKIPLDSDSFADHYPILPARFDLLLQLVRALARRTGGLGLRSAIRLVQDLLVDRSRLLAAGLPPMADRPVGDLVAADDLFDTLRADLAKEFPQAVEGADAVARHPLIGADALAVRVAKAAAILQPLENMPRGAEQIAALLYQRLGAPGEVEAVRKALYKLVDMKEFGLVELRSESAGGAATFLYLSDEVQPVQKKRDSYRPPESELNAARVEALRRIFDPVPEVRLSGTRPVRAKLLLGRTVVAGEDGEIRFQLEEEESGRLDARLSDTLRDTVAHRDLQNAVVWLFSRPEGIDDLLLDVCRSVFVVADAGRSKDQKADVTRYLRSEERRAERARDAVRSAYLTELARGVLVFQGRKRAVSELHESLVPAASAFLNNAAQTIFDRYAVVGRKIDADCATKLIDLQRLDRATPSIDPLGLVQTTGGRPSIQTQHPALQEALRAFKGLLQQSGSGRVQGAALMDHLAGPPYGWSKDATRYLFAALVLAQEVELHTGDGVLKTAGPKAAEAVRTIPGFGRVGVSPRNQRVPVEALDRASRRLEEMFAVEVLPLEDQISRTVRQHFPEVVERIGPLPPRLRLLKLPGEERATATLQACVDLLKEDAGGASSILGVKDTSLPEDVRWAKGIVEALSANGEKDILTARRLLDDLLALGADFEEAVDLANHEAVATLQDSLRSEDFSSRMADLRGAIRSLNDAVEKELRRQTASLDAEIEAVERRLQARPSWGRLTGYDEETGRPGEREALIAQLRPAPGKDARTTPLDTLRRVLLRRLGLLRLEEDLARRCDALGPEPEPEEPTDVADPQLEDDGDDVDPPDRVSWSALLAPMPIRSVADVEAAIALVREHLLDRLALGPFTAGDEE